MTVTTRRFNPADPRLGRHVRHDSRSLEYAHGVLPRSAIKTVHWTRRTGPFDQGQIGSCTFNAGAGALVTDSKQRPGVTQVTVEPDSYGIFIAGSYTVDEPFIVEGYSLTTRGDSYPGAYPPDDTGSDGLGVMKAMQALGLVDTYTHAFVIPAVQSALQSGPVMWGTTWLDSMYDTDSSGYLVVDRQSGVAGGHEMVLTGYEVGTDVYEGWNSWGPGFGLGGRFLITGRNLTWLLNQDGDITVPHWAIAPVPRVPITNQQMYDKIKAWYAPGPAVSNLMLRDYSREWAADQRLS
jgi:hypothetical protein